MPPSAIPGVDFTPAKKAIQSQHLDLRFDGVLNERYSLVVLPPSSELNTACWSYMKGSGSGDPSRHIITFGPKLAESQKSGDLGDYAASYHRHELGHSLWTDRDLAALGMWCDANGVPFDALNVFEDARIEHIWREKFDMPFSWESFEGPRGNPKAVDPLPSRAMDGMMALIQNEAQAGVMEGRLADLPEKDEVKAFYDRTVLAETTQDLFPLLKEWKHRFGFPENMSEGASKATGGDMKAGAMAQKDKKTSAALKEAEKDSMMNTETKTAPSVGKEQSVTITGIGATAILLPKGSSCDTVDQIAAARLADILRGAFSTRERRITRSTPAKRIAIRNMVLEREKIYRGKERSAPGPVQMTFIFDCSGSMSGSPSEAGRRIVAALGILAREGKVRGDLILTKGLSGDALNEVYPLKNVDAEFAARIPSDGHFEGFASAMESNGRRLRENGLLLAYTDGSITDQKIDRKLWHARGVYSIGCYVGGGEGQKSPSESLGKWFDTPLCRATDAGLALALRDLIAARARQSEAIQARMAVSQSCTPRFSRVEERRIGIGV